MSDQKTYETIEAYVNGELTGTALANFEKELRTNSQLAQEVSLFREMDVALSEQPVLEFQKLVGAQGAAYLEKNNQTAVVRKMTWSRQLISLAATAAILIGALLVWQLSSRTAPSGQELFAQHFETYALNQSLRSDAAPQSAAFNSAIQQYQAGNYAAATQSFQRLAESNDSDMELAFCLANAYLNQSPPKYSDAQAQFAKIINEGNSIYVLRAKWYSALIHLEKGEMESARNLLNDVAKSNDNFGIEAGEILEEL